MITLPTQEEAQILIDKALKEKDGDSIRRINEIFTAGITATSQEELDVKDLIYHAWTNIKLRRFATSEDI